MEPRPAWGDRIAGSPSRWTSPPDLAAWRQPRSDAKPRGGRSEPPLGELPAPRPFSRDAGREERAPGSRRARGRSSMRLCLFSRIRLNLGVWIATRRCHRSRVA